MTPTLFRKILIANRGEIAVRIIRTCKEMGIETVAIYSTPDRDALHAQLADEAVCVGPAKAQDSYLNIKNILSAAILTGCEAIHPGFGFLSENPSFADLVKRCGLVFIGPDGDVIRAMGNKSEARRLMRECGVPVVPGSEGGVESVEQGLTAAEEIGYPVLIKASAGAAGAVCARRFRPRNSSRHSQPQKPKPRHASGTTRCTSKASPAAKAYRISDSGRQPRECHSSRRARLLNPAAQPEDD